MQNNPPVIDCEGLVREFGNYRAVDRISFQVPKAAVFGLLGPNGSGKTTTIRILCGVLEASSGSVKVLGHDLSQGTEIIKPYVGYMSQRFGMYGDLTVRENLTFFGRVHGFKGSELEGRVESQVEQLELLPYESRLAQHLSGGWKQRLAFGCAQIHDPQLVFLDEPTAGIDPVARRELWDLIYERSNRGVTFVVTTHYMDEAERCTHIGYLHQSKLLICGRTKEIIANSESYLGDSHLYELIVDNAADLLPRLGSAKQVLHASLFGHSIHVTTQNDTDLSRILADFGLNISPDSYRRIPPTMEDVFVGLSSVQEKKIENGTTNVEKTIVSPTTLVPPKPNSQSEYSTRLMAKQVSWLSGFLAVVGKEFSQIRRQPSTLFFMLFLPVLQTLLFGYAIQLNVQNVSLAVLDLDQSQESRHLISSFKNSGKFKIAERLHRMSDVETSLRCGNAAAALVIPANFSSQILQERRADAQVLVDGSNFQTATAALTATKLISINYTGQIAASTRAGPSGDSSGESGIKIRTRALFNEGLESSRFFVPGLIGIILQLVTLALTTFSIVRERENGTLEQIFVTPIGKSELLAGKIAPYAIIGILECVIVVLVMILVFDVPIVGSILLLAGLTLLFITCSLAMGVLVSTLAKSQLAAMELAYSITLPSVLLSGFMYPRSEMPEVIFHASNILPATHYIEIVRGIVLKGASLPELATPILWLLACTTFIVVLSMARFRKQLG